MSMRVALHTRLKPGREEEYERAHREVPDELIQAIRDAGVHDWTIWRSGLDLFHLIDCTDYAAVLAALNGLPVNVAWQARMAGYLDVVHDYSDSGSGLPAVWRLPPGQ
jgi:L-rhamnose mutarotase